MNAKNCRLCGKPLSRIRVNAGDFCSREHRNEYRLRRGMDRLAEANKVASLMRRRENLRPISAAQIGDSVMANRGFFTGRISAGRPAPSSYPGARPRLYRPFVAPAAQVELKPSGAAFPESRVARSVRYFSGSRLRLAMPARDVHFPVTVPHASVALVHYYDPSSGSARHLDLQRTPLRLSLGDGICRLTPAALPSGYYTRHAQDPCPVPIAAQTGRALRVSSGLGFHAPALRYANRGDNSLPPLELTWPESLPAVVTLPGRATPQILKIGLRAPGMRSPLFRAEAAPTDFHWPGALPMSEGGPQDTTEPAVRFWGNRWEKPSLRIQSCAAHLANGHMSLPQYPALPLIRVGSIPNAPTADSGAPHVDTARFKPQDSVLPQGPANIQGSFSGGAFGPTSTPTIASAPEKAPAPVEPEPDSEAPVFTTPIEERFGNGWENWEGGVEEWKLDVAGVRTGPLALFKPSLEMRDYELEFLARLETRSITWVFRASSFEEYYMATIAVAPAGGFQLSRCTVSGGTVGPEVTLPLPPNPKAKPTFTVRTRVSGTEFAVTINGETIDRWTDSRLPVGGIGFIGTTDDRARLYWVRLSPGGSPAKESQAK